MEVESHLRPVPIPSGFREDYAASERRKLKNEAAFAAYTRKNKVSSIYRLTMNNGREYDLNYDPTKEQTI